MQWPQKRRAFHNTILTQFCSTNELWQCENGSDLLSCQSEPLVLARWGFVAQSKKKKLILRSKRNSYLKDRRICSIQQSQCMFPGADRDWNRTHLLQPHSSVLQEDRGVNGVLVKLLRSVSPEDIDFTFDIWDLEANLETFPPLWLTVWCMSQRREAKLFSNSSDCHLLSHSSDS